MKWIRHTSVMKVEEEQFSLLTRHRSEGVPLAGRLMLLSPSPSSPLSPPHQAGDAGWSVSHS